MNTYDQVLQVKSDFETKVEKVKASKDLSSQGKQKALASLAAEKQAALRAVVPTLRRQAIEAALKVKKLANAQAALAEIESEKMDYGRLTYEAQAVKSALALAGGDPYEVSKAWEAVKKTGDRYRIRAFLDVVPATIPEDSLSEQSWAELREDMKQNVELTRSAEAAGYAQEQRVHLDELADISRVAGLVADDLGAGTGAAYQGANVFARVLEGITLDRQTNELHIDFGEVNDDMPEFTYQRLEAERAEREKEQAEFFKRSGTEYDPLLDGV